MGRHIIALRAEKMSARVLTDWKGARDLGATGLPVYYCPGGRRRTANPQTKPEPTALDGRAADVIQGGTRATVTEEAQNRGGRRVCVPQCLSTRAKRKKSTQDLQ